MEHRIRAAVILVEDHKILLVKHVDPLTGEEWWVPPGGGLQNQDASIFDCAKREVYEETGLTVTIGPLIYLREFREVSADTRHLELFFLAGSYTGHLTIANIIGKGPDEEFIKEVRWLDSHEISSLTVFPQILGSEFWKHLKEGFASVRYLGVQNDQLSA